MRAVLLLLLALALGAQGRYLQGNDSSVGSQILNGRDDPELGLFDKGRFPYVVQIRYPWADPAGPGRDKFICAGTLITPDMVLTSAWCAVNAGLLPLVRINSWRTEERAGLYEARQAVAMALHGGWPGQRDDRIADDNLAVLRLNKPATKTKPIGSLPPAFPSPAVPLGTKMSILGWGSIRSYADPLAENLRGGSQLLLSQRRCFSKWSRFRPPVINAMSFSSMKVICAAYPGHNKALCRGDQGAPMVRRGTGPDKDMLVGVGVMTSCTGRGDLGGSVYANVPYYQGWIKTAMALLRAGARSTSEYRIVYTKDVNGGQCGQGIGYPCSTSDDCCTRQCNFETQRCWF